MNDQPPASTPPPASFLDDATVAALAEALRAAYGRERPLPLNVPEVAPVPEQGLGAAALPKLWQTMLDGGTALASPLMSGHMDTAPHPVAALTDALVSALNNNLLFRELSPFASAVEESLCADMARRLGLPDTARGTFVSGGTLANLTALFAACGGFERPSARERVRIFVPECAHASIAKSAAVLGVGDLITVPGDAQGRMDPMQLRAKLNSGGGHHDIVVAVLGSTVHGAVENLDPLVTVCDEAGAWLHVDAVYGGALAFSRAHRHWLEGLERADSVAVGPQKWLYVPRLSAMVFLRDQHVFERRLGRELSYSVSGGDHRGAFGLQGSRRADALTLWVTLQVLGAQTLSTLVDGSIAHAARLYALAAEHPLLEPTHMPDLNLLCLRAREPRCRADRLRAAHARLEAAGGPWLSLSAWRGEPLLRCVLLNPAIDEPFLTRLLGAAGEALGSTAEAS